jgi:hypothetical protein
MYANASIDIPGREDRSLANGRFRLPRASRTASTRPRRPVGGFVTPTAEAEWRRLNAEVREATQHG